MKRLMLIAAIALTARYSSAQSTPFADGVRRSNLPVVYLPENVSVQFISPEPIQYVDISAKTMIGDLPLKNVLRIRLRDSTKVADAVVTITGEKFMAQYRIIRADSITARDSRTEIPIALSDTRPLDISGVGLSQIQLKTMALDLFAKSPRANIETSEAFGVKAALYHLYTAGDYIFVDLGYRNKNNLWYDVDELRWHIDDKKIAKATNVQSVELKPEFVLFDITRFQKSYRNIIVLRKLSFPGNKILHIELSEKQISGRVVTLSIPYQDLLDADIIPL
ncbi:MAG: DUF4138 domain-containing protein [Bacteroidetes bacterium]|nr:DUF4138 domain-containing protein [Bacteroidota bacterium]